MLDDDTKELVRNLSSPHRVLNPVALFKFCERAATIIQDQAAALHQAAADTLKAQPAKTAPKKDAKK
jgi:hypothetical protein|tara:strand:- start:723 stop:923 length:201 start_codon:yes stop_codon:yes gene_type:complete